MSTARTAPLAFPLPEDLLGRTVGRFVIRSRLGAGGMGEVYYAEDPQLKRPVALKRVSRNLGSTPESREQILHEAQRASALQSDHIASVYDVVEDLGEVFLVMEYVEGRTLRERLREPVTLEQFFEIATQCAEALVAAHQHGIVHCDIKPENIMLTADGRVKILDFGVAKHLPRSDQSSTLDSRKVGGTPCYMAPEVLLEDLPDPRSDIFSLGVVLYEMLTRKNPFLTESFIATSERVLHTTPSAIRLFNSHVPEELEAVVMKAMAKPSAQRFADAGELLRSLQALQRGESVTVARGTGAFTLARRRPVLWRGAVVLLVLLALSVFPGLWPHKIALPARRNLAVFPFVAADADPSTRAFSQGLAETLTAKLSQLTDRYPIEVVSASEVRAQSVASLESAKANLGVNLVLEGSFQQAGRSVRVNYNLVDAGTHRVLRADTITSDAGDPFALEDRVVDSALHALDLELSSSERQSLAARGTGQPDAYDFYLRGRGYLQDYQKPENIDSAIEVFQRALERDPKYGLAYAGLGESYWQKYELTHDRSWVTKALEACQRAGQSGTGFTCLGVVYNGTGRYEEAASSFQRALDADRTSDAAYRGLAAAYEHTGKFADAEQTYRRAITIRPGYWSGYSWLGAFLFNQGRYEEAVKAFSQVTTLAPDNIRGYNNLGGTYLALGRYADAISAFEKSVAIQPNEDAYSNLGAAYLFLRRFSEASRACERAVQFDGNQFVLWANLANAYYWEPGRRGDSVAPYHKAIALSEEELRVNPRNAVSLSYLAVFHAMIGEEKPAWTALDRSLVLAPADATVLMNAALVANQLGEADKAIAWLRKSLAAGQSLDVVRNTVDFDNLHSNKKFQNLLQEKIPAEQ